MSQTIHIIDSHTGGEPTRAIISGGPDLGSGSMAERRRVFREKFDHVRRAVVCEPRGSDVMVGALLCDRVDPACAAGVMFFNNVDVLNMCGHGTIGVMVTLAHLGRIKPGVHKLETAVGMVTAVLHEDGHRVSFDNVPSYRYRKDVTVEVDGYGRVTGDIAWGGNWFFICGDHRQQLTLDRTDELTNFTRAIRHALERDGVTGADEGLIDHIELFAPVNDGSADSRNFVLCPGMAYDRSPCGTGTSAKIACLAADGKLPEGKAWRQQSIVGSVFEGSFTLAADQRNDAAGPVIIPRITGSAYVNGDGKLIVEDDDPFGWGIG